jgi:hypothetical protein
MNLASTGFNCWQNCTRASRSLGTLNQRAQTAGEGWPELERSPPDRLIGDIEPTFGQDFLHISITERELQVEPDGMPDDLGRELVTAIEDGLHSLPYRASAPYVSRSRDNAFIPIHD